MTETKKVAVVTGASSGIGAATARALAAAGFDVVPAARRADRIQALADEIGGRAAVLDVTDRAAVDAFAAGLDRVDVLVNCAGGAFGADFLADSDPADWQRMYDINVLGTLHVTQALLPTLIAGGGGTVVLMGSTAGLAPYEAAAGTSRPNTPYMRWPARCGWNWSTNLSGSSKSPPAWCGRTSSPSTGMAAIRPRQMRFIAGWPSL